MRASTGAGPRCVMLFSRVDFAWLNPVIMRIMRERYKTRFVLAIPDASWRERCDAWIGPQDRIVDLAELAAQIRAMPVDPATVLETARRNEARHNLVYMRDIVQGDRSISAYYMRYAPNSPWTSVEPPPFVSLMAEINRYFEFFDKLFADERIDMVLERPGGIMVNACIHAALSRGIPVSFSLPSRYKSYVMWSYGPYLDHTLISEKFAQAPDVPPIPREQLQPPDDSARNIQNTQDWRSTGRLLRSIAAIVRDHVIWAVQSGSFRRGRKIGMWAAIRYRIAVWRGFRLMDRLIESDVDKIAERPFVLFLLQLEPEFTTLSLAREFNNTRAILQQMALSMPADHRLVVKEHATNIGNRDMGFYEDLARLPNVVLADYRIPGLQLAGRATAVATVSGTVGVEATLMGKPVVIFAEHVEYGFLANIATVTAMRDLPQILAKAISLQSPQVIEATQRAGARYREAITAISFDAPDTPVFRGHSEHIAPEQAERAVDLLVENYRRQIEFIIPLQTQTI